MKRLTMITWIVDRYKIVKKLASTNDSEIYLCKDYGGENELVAVKVFKYNLENKMLENYFKRECEVLSLLRHENIINIFDEGFDKEQKLFYIVLEYVEGKTLEEAIKDKTIKAYDREALVWQLLDAINYAHSQNILHRDIKPSNIMITSDGKIKVIDFGISKIIDSFRTDGENFTIQALTLKYASPEQKIGKSLTFQSDIYSLGLVLCEIYSIGFLDINRPIKKQVMNCSLLSEEKREIVAQMVEEDVNKRTTNIYKVQNEWKKCKSKKIEGYSLNISRNAIKKLVELGLISKEEKYLASSFILDDLSRDVYFASAKVAYKSKDSKNYLLFGKQVEYSCAIDNRSMDSLTIISVSIPDTYVLEWRKDTFGFKSDKRWYFELEKKKLIDVNKLINSYNEKQRKVSATRDRNINTEEIVKKWSSILEIQKELIENNKNTLRYSGIRYNSIDGRLQLKIKNQVQDVEFTQDQMMVITLKGNKNFKPGRAGYFSNFKNGYLYIDIIRGLDINIFANSGEVSVETAFMDNLINKQENSLKRVKNNECVNRNLPKLLSDPKCAKINYLSNDLQFRNKLLDDNKKKIIEEALSAKDIYLLQGPPGTGKTTFISELVIQQLTLNPSAKILVASQSNVAVNHAMNKITKDDSSIKVVRLGREEMIANGMENYTINAQADDIIEKIKSRVNKYFEHIQSRNFDKNLFDKYNLLNEVLSIEEKIKVLIKEISYDKEFKTKKEKEYYNKRSKLDKLEALKSSFYNIEISKSNSFIEEFIEEYIKLGEDFIEQYEILIKLEDELEIINRYIDDKNNKIKNYQNDLSAGYDILAISKEKNIEQYRLELEKKIEKQKKKFDQFSKYEKLKNDWLKRINQSEELEKILIEEVSVIGATCIGIANFSNNFNLKFDLVIIDEAGRATPPELLIPMVLGKKIVLVGDQKQLPPVIDKVLSDEIKLRHNFNRREVEESLFSYLQKNLNDDCKNILREQYRMNPIIGDLISTIFYNDNIISRVNMEDRKHYYDEFENNSIVWIDTKNVLDKFEEAIGTTKQNTLEANEVINLLKKMDSNYLERGIKKSVAIIAGYKAQKNLINRIIDKEGIEFKNIEVEVDTVDAFQGRETDIVIYSIVRSNSIGDIGFLSDQRRLNVSLSRARELLIIIGDSECVLKNGRNPFIKVYDYIENNEYCKIEVI